jgi:hypothetical protein
MISPIDYSAFPFLPPDVSVDKTKLKVNVKITCDVKKAMGKLWLLSADADSATSSRNRRGGIRM